MPFGPEQPDGGRNALYLEGQTSFQEWSTYFGGCPPLHVSRCGVSVRHRISLHHCTNWKCELSHRKYVLFYCFFYGFGIIINNWHQLLVKLIFRLEIIWNKNHNINKLIRNLYFLELINYTQPIYVWRDDPDSRQKSVKELIKRATSKLDWPQILIFPEGTCTNRTCLISFKNGAFYPGVPIQPVCIRYPNKLDTVTWTWEGPSAWV